MEETITLSEREQEILRLVATGASNKEIAQQLSISPNTVKVHVRNIFAKIGVSSRTEATLYAIREGLVAAPGGEAAVASPQPVAVIETELPHRGKISRQQFYLLSGLVVLAVIAGLLLRPLIMPASPLPTLPSDPARWQSKAPLPQARAGMAGVAFNDQIYVIGGETAAGVTGECSLYTPASDTWKEMAAKPTPVTDVSAAAIGGKIYVPGGRTASGNPTAVLESYDPRSDEWSARSPLPVALSAYALASLEGKLYLFGGWDGSKALSAVYEYDPGSDSWRERTAMPTPRAWAGAAVVGGDIYVVGGYDGRKPLAQNEMYTPTSDDGNGSPWQKRHAMPDGRYQFGLSSLVDTLYVVGGITSRQTGASPLRYQSQTDTWEFIGDPGRPASAGLALVPYQTFIYAVGGKEADQLTTTNLAYQALFTIYLPGLH